MIRFTALTVFLILTLFLSGCPRDIEIINHLVLSEEYSQGVIGGYGRFLFNWPEEKAGTAEFEQEEFKTGKWIPFVSVLYEIRGIMKEKYPDYANYYYIRVFRKWEENIEAKKGVERQILADLKENNWDLTGDGQVDEADRQEVIDAASRPRGEIDEAAMAQAPALLKMLFDDLAVQPRSKSIATWGRIK